MCKGCKQLTGRALDVYAAAMTYPPDRREDFLNRVEGGRWRGKLLPMIREHAAADAKALA